MLSLNLLKFSYLPFSIQAYRRISTVLWLAKLYGNAELELTLMYATQMKTISTKSIKLILEKKLYLTKNANNVPEVKNSLFNNYTNIRGADEYK